MLRHLHLLQDNVNHVKDVYVYKHHWNWDVLRQLNENGIEYPWKSFIPAEKYRYLYIGTNEVYTYDKNLLYFAPNMSTENIRIMLEKMTLERSEFCKNSASSVTPTASRKFGRGRSQIAALESSQEKEIRKDNFTKDRKLPRNNATWKREYEKNQKIIEDLKLQLGELQLKSNKMEELLTKENVISHGLSRINITKQLPQLLLTSHIILSYLITLVSMIALYMTSKNVLKRINLVIIVLSMKQYVTIPSRTYIIMGLTVTWNRKKYNWKYYFDWISYMNRKNFRIVHLVIMSTS